MNIKQINFDNSGDPEEVVVSLTATEVGFLTATLGKQTGTEASEIFPGGGKISSEMYYSLFRTAHFIFPEED